MEFEDSTTEQASAFRESLLSECWEQEATDNRRDRIRRALSLRSMRNKATTVTSVFGGTLVSSEYVPEISLSKDSKIALGIVTCIGAGVALGSAWESRQARINSGLNAQELRLETQKAAQFAELPVETDQ